MKIVVLGASGQLGSCLRQVSAARSLDTISFPSEEEGNILAPELLHRLFEREKPDYVINCAAYTAVDKAEDDIETCRLVNSKGAANVAETCRLFHAVLVHISTDFVFKGDVPKLLS